MSLKEDEASLSEADLTVTGQVGDVSYGANDRTKEQKGNEAEVRRQPDTRHLVTSYQVGGACDIVTSSTLQCRGENMS